MKYIIYKTINLINNKIYIGQHSTNNINDSYLGSGIFIKKAIKKYGEDNFKKEIMFVFDSFKDMNNKEIELVNKDFIKRRDTYNMIFGGNSGLARFSPEKRKQICKKIAQTMTNKNNSGTSIADRTYIKRTATILKNNPNGLKDIGKKSSITQIKNGTNKGLNNANARLVPFTIYDRNNKRVCSMLLTELKTKHNSNLPSIRMIQLSLKNHGAPMYKRNHRRQAEKFKGWYALFNDHQRTKDITILEYEKHTIIKYSYKFYNNHGSLINTCNSKNFRSICISNGYPENSFRYSYRHNGKPIKHIKYNGWYTRKIGSEVVKNFKS